MATSTKVIHIRIWITKVIHIRIWITLVLVVAIGDPYQNLDQNFQIVSLWTRWKAPCHSRCGP